MTELPITHFHVFPFSARKNTVAAKMENQIQHHIKKERVKILNNLGEIKLKDFAETFIGKEIEVLTEIKKNNLWEGYCSQFIKVAFESKEDLHNKIVKIKIEKFKDEKLWGRVV